MDVDEKKSLLGKIIGVLALIFGGFIGRYNWESLLVIIFGAVVFYWLASKFNKNKSELLLFVIAILGGHFTWLLIAFLFSGVSYILFDIILIFIGVLWIVLKPSLGPVILLMVYESISLVLNFFRIATTEFEVVIFAAILLHVALRVSVMVLLLMYIKELRKGKQVNKYWYYVKNDTQEGPISRTQLQQLIDEGILNAESLVWTETLTEWTSIKSLDYFNLKIPVTPPALPIKDNIISKNQI